MSFSEKNKMRVTDKKHNDENDCINFIFKLD